MVRKKKKRPHWSKGVDQNTESWILDRVENEDPLLWKEFITNMGLMGVSDKELLLYRSSRYRKKVKKIYTALKKETQMYDRYAPI